MIMCAVAAVGGSYAAEGAEGESAISSMLKSSTKGISTSASESIAFWGRQMLNVSGMLSGVAGTLEGFQLVDQGKVLQEIADIKGNISILSNLLTLNQKQISSSQKNLSTQMQTFESMISNFSNFSAANQAAAQTLMQG